MGTQIPKNESAASWEIKCRANDPAMPHIVLRNGRSTARAQQCVEKSYSAYCDSVAQKLYVDSLHAVKGRQPGSRVEFKDGYYVVV